MCVIKFRVYKASYASPRQSTLAAMSGDSVIQTLCDHRYKALHSMVPLYLKELCILPTNERRSTLRSADRQGFVRNRTSSKCGERAFSIAAPITWNLLPADMHDIDLLQTPTLDTFKQNLKTFIFLSSYSNL